MIGRSPRYKGNFSVKPNELWETVNTGLSVSVQRCVRGMSCSLKGRVLCRTADLGDCVRQTLCSSDRSEGAAVDEPLWQMSRVRGGAGEEANLD